MDPLECSAMYMYVCSVYNWDWSVTFVLNGELSSAYTLKYTKIVENSSFWAREIVLYMEVIFVFFIGVFTVIHVLHGWGKYFAVYS